MQFLRICQEALTNVRRHSQATEVEITIERNNGSIDMIIKDNGTGFEAADLENSPPGYHGLSIVKERAETMGGDFNISTAPGEGTALMVSLPIEKVRF